MTLSEWTGTEVMSLHFISPGSPKVFPSPHKQINLQGGLQGIQFVCDRTPNFVKYLDIPPS